MTICTECGKEKQPDTFYDSNGDSQIAQHVATNSVGSWRKEMCRDCWSDFTNRAFCSIRRSGNTFTAICAF